MTHKLLAALAAGLAVSLAACGSGDDAAAERTRFERPDDRSKGSPDAPVTIIEYASVACGGCAMWHQFAYPVVDEAVETGDVRLVFRDMITGQPQIATAGFMLAECAAPERYFDVIDVLFSQQQALFAAMQRGEARTQFEAIARSIGLSQDEFRACMENEDVLATVREASEAASRDGIGSTPTFLVNGETLETIANPQGSGQVWALGGAALTDAAGAIPATYEAEAWSRLIEVFKARADGRDPTEIAPAAETPAEAPATEAPATEAPVEAPAQTPADAPAEADPAEEAPAEEAPAPEGGR